MANREWSQGIPSKKMNKQLDHIIHVEKCKHGQTLSGHLCKDCQQEWRDKVMSFIGSNMDIFNEMFLLLKQGGKFTDPITFKPFEKSGVIHTHSGTLEVRIYE